MQLSITIEDKHKSLSALKSLNEELLISIIKKYLSEIGNSEKELEFLSFLLIDRLEQLFTDLINQTGGFDEINLKSIAQIFANLDIISLSEEIDDIRKKIRDNSQYFTYDLAVTRAKDYLNTTFKKIRFPLTAEASEYLTNRVIEGDGSITLRKITSELYWIYNEIKIGDTVRKVTKRGETIGIVRSKNEKVLVEAEGKEYSLTSAWNKLTTRLNFDEISLIVYLAARKLFLLKMLIKEGPFKSQFLKGTIGHRSSEQKAKLLLLSASPLKNIAITQLALSETDKDFNEKNIISIFELQEEIEFDSFTSDEELLDALIFDRVLEIFNANQNSHVRI
ncbi:hypothetical protein [Leptospira sarikeiensis]|uniref:Uncharacterized protein n=1 Tax=Leptospira sarikeiensis TaxID=2484943 RepID=A0A4R9KHN8_9LEPT|nr:hypothetical protein [Leptospira sarikeiensis]TGL65947.1 hypothetical protein EHQ64_00030 [Leptospira sarikeiensis]